MRFTAASVASDVTFAPPTHDPPGRAGASVASDITFRAAEGVGSGQSPGADWPV